MNLKSDKLTKNRERYQGIGRKYIRHHRDNCLGASPGPAKSA